MEPTAKRIECGVAAVLAITLLSGVTACGRGEGLSASEDHPPAVAIPANPVVVRLTDRDQTAAGITSARWELRCGSVPGAVAVGFTTDRGEHRVYEPGADGDEGLLAAFAAGEAVALELSLTRVKGEELVSQLALLGADAAAAVEDAAPQLKDLSLSRWELHAGGGSFRLDGFVPVPPHLWGPASVTDVVGNAGGAPHPFHHRIPLARCDSMEDGQGWVLWIQINGR